MTNEDRIARRAMPEKSSHASTLAEMTDSAVERLMTLETKTLSGAAPCQRVGADQRKATRSSSTASVVRSQVWRQAHHRCRVRHAHVSASHIRRDHRSPGFELKRQATRQALGKLV